MVGGELSVGVKRDSYHPTTVSTWLLGVEGVMQYVILAVDNNTETIDNPLHEAAKRGNLPFLQECLANRVSMHPLSP